MSFDCCYLDKHSSSSDKNSNLTFVTKQEKMEYPERIGVIYKLKEMDKMWGSAGHQINVNDRQWMKVK